MHTQMIILTPPYVDWEEVNQIDLTIDQARPINTVGDGKNLQDAKEPNVSKSP